MKNKKPRSPFAKQISGKSKTAAFRRIPSVKDVRTRNLVRGAIANPRGNSPSPDAINTLRQSASPQDLATSIQLLLGRDGAFPFPNLAENYRSLVRQHSLNKIPIRSEIAFIAGHLNGWTDEVCNIIGAMGLLAQVPESAPADAMGAVAAFAERYGASSYVVRKIAYLMSRYSDNVSLQEPFQRITNKLAQSKYPGPFFWAMELLDADFPLFAGVTTRVQVYHKKLEHDDFRQLLPLHDIVPVPLSRTDLAAHLRKAHSTSLVDEIVSIICTMHLRSYWPEVYEELVAHLDGDIVAALDVFRATRFDASLLYSDIDPLEADMNFYRRSLSFIEFEPCTKYRAFVDATIAPRLMPSCPPIIDDVFRPASPISLRDITKSLQGFHQPFDYLKSQSCGQFLRTCQFLRFIETNTGAIDQHDMRFLCEHTTALDVLLSEHEIERLYSSADDDSRPLVTVLALALHKARSRDEDVDFKFRFALCQTVKSQFRGRLEDFIEWLLGSTPQIAQYLLWILDRQTLQKLYWLIRSADEADTTRQALLRTVGKKRGLIEYFIEADAIEAQRQVSKLRKYFDDSRIYVDGIAMKEWLIANPSVYAQQYVKMIEHHVTLPAVTARVENGQIVLAGAGEVPAETTFDYILLEVARVAYEQFCVNRQFGIESYLGRRIRHNTLTGMMRGGVEDLIELPSYRVLTYDDKFVAANDAWINSYRRLIEHLRRDLLQFRTESKPQGVFKAALREDENTILSIATLRGMILAAKNPELMNELLIRFCWQEINPQLQAAAKFISVDLVKEAYDRIEQHFENFSEDLQRQYRQHLREAVHERFTRLASWFRQPEDGFVSASTRQLGDLILLEALDASRSDDRSFDWDGVALDTQLDGLSVHRMYDCLFVLLRNALKYGADDAVVTISAIQQTLQHESVSRIKVSVSSQIEESELLHHKSRLADSFAAEDSGEAMAVEGYSGIRKLRYLTRSSEGGATADYQIVGNSCTVSFSLTVELAAREKSPS